MADDPNLPPVVPPTPVPAPRDPAPRDNRIVCEFCECRVNGRGEYLELSDKARGWRDGREKDARTIADLTEKIASLERQLATVKTELTAARTPAKAGFFE